MLEVEERGDSSVSVSRIGRKCVCDSLFTTLKEVDGANARLLKASKTDPCCTERTSPSRPSSSS